MKPGYQEVMEKRWLSNPNRNLYAAKTHGGKLDNSLGYYVTFVK